MYEVQNYSRVMDMMAVIKLEQIHICALVFLPISQWKPHRERLASVALPTTRLPQMSGQVTCGTKSCFSGTWINSWDAKLAPESAQIPLGSGLLKGLGKSGFSPRRLSVTLLFLM